MRHAECLLDELQLRTGPGRIEHERDVFTLDTIQRAARRRIDRKSPRVEQRVVQVAKPQNRGSGRMRGFSPPKRAYPQPLAGHIQSGWYSRR